MYIAASCLPSHVPPNQAARMFPWEVSSSVTECCDLALRLHDLCSRAAREKASGIRRVRVGESRSSWGGGLLTGMMSFLLTRAGCDSSSGGGSCSTSATKPAAVASRATLSLMVLCVMKFQVQDGLIPRRGVTGRHVRGRTVPLLSRGMCACLVLRGQSSRRGHRARGQ